MSLIHKLSNVTTLSEFDLFGVPPTQSTIDHDILTEHRPIAALDSKTFIEFNITSADDEYIRLDKTWLYIRLRINIAKPLNAKVALEDWKKISTVNNLLNSLFKQIDLTIGDRIITPPHQTYSYKTDFEIKLGKSKDAKDTFMSSGFWFENKDLKPEDINSKISELISPDTKDDFSKGREVDLMGKIHLSMFEQPKALLGGCNIRLKLIPNDPSFYIMCSDEVRVSSVEFTEASLYIHRSKVHKHIKDGHKKGLEHANAKYFLRESFVVPVTINKGTMDTIIDNVHNGILPKRAFVAFVDHSAFNGSTKLNPYNYQNFDLTDIACYLNGIPYPGKPFSPDFEKGLYVREYLSLFESTNQDNVDSCITIDRKSFINGNNIFCINFSPDLNSGCCSTGYVNLIKHGSLRLRVRFRKPLDKAITALVYMDFDSLLEINQERNPEFI